MEKIHEFFHILWLKKKNRLPPQAADAAPPGRRPVSRASSLRNGPNKKKAHALSRRGSFPICFLSIALVPVTIHKDQIVHVVKRTIPLHHSHSSFLLILFYSIARFFCGASVFLLISQIINIILCRFAILLLGAAGGTLPATGAAARPIAHSTGFFRCLTHFFVYFFSRHGNLSYVIMFHTWLGPRFKYFSHISCVFYIGG